MEGGESKDTSGEEGPNVLPMEEVEPNASTGETSESTPEFPAGASQPDVLPEKSGEPPVVQGTPARPVPRRKPYLDEIHGSKEVSEIAVALMDAPEFQRLAHIYQLGTTLNVFRGATHSRFDHCVGTYFMSRTLMRRVVQTTLVSTVLTAMPSLILVAGSLRDRICTHRGRDRPTNVPTLEGEVARTDRTRLRRRTSARSGSRDCHTMEDEFSILGKHDGLGGSRLFAWRASAAELLDVLSCTDDKAERRNARPTRALRPRIEKEKEIGEAV